MSYQFGVYQYEADRTMDHAGGRDKLIGEAAMGIASEGGELINHLKKVLYHGHEPDYEFIAEEAGDLLWYVNAICTIFDLDLATVAKDNVRKLRERYPEGFSSEASINRSV